MQSSPVSEKLLVATQPPKDGNSNKRLTKREKLLVAFIAFLLSMFVLLAVVFGFLYVQVHSNSPIQEGSAERLHQSVYPCVTKDCVITSTGNVRIQFFYASCRMLSSSMFLTYRYKSMKYGARDESLAVFVLYAPWPPE